jgi:hypothetical protein
MPKNKRKLIGYVRPKKKPISEEEKALEEASITHDLDPIPEEVAPMPPEASLSAMSIADGGSNDAPPQEPLQESSKSRLSQMKAAEKAARHKLVVVRRRWCKTGRTHFNQEHGGARWATESELERALGRLQKVDNELDEAKRLYVDAHRERVLYCAMTNLKKKAEQEQDLEERVQLLRLVNKMVDKCSRHNYAMTRRVLRVRANLEVPRTPMSTGEQIELLCEDAGLAQAYQWVHLSELI